MSKINSYELKEGINVETLSSLGFKDGCWWDKESECMSKTIMLIDEIELCLRIRVNPIQFDDFEDILVLDGDFCQAYTPFYGDNYKNDISDFPFLESVISRYNQAMDIQGIFIKGDDAGNSICYPSI